MNKSDTPRKVGIEEVLKRPGCAELRRLHEATQPVRALQDQLRKQASESGRLKVSDRASFMR